MTVTPFKRITKEQYLTQIEEMKKEINVIDMSIKMHHSDIDALTDRKSDIINKLSELTDSWIDNDTID